ncbi:hypothetical protein MIR68_004783 [Amoeboaphelidium protococcarum]|nr:hypothetical protein MIR68_004783 [Amoeboaphelidium protococcarum]
MVKYKLVGLGLKAALSVNCQEYEKARRVYRFCEDNQHSPRSRADRIVWSRTVHRLNRWSWTAYGPVQTGPRDYQLVH